MIATIEVNGRSLKVDLSAPIDLSMPLDDHPERTTAWYVAPMQITPVRTDQFTGSIAEGGDVNFRNIFFNPHGNGTHTECVGHITEEVHNINKVLTTYFFEAQLITVEPELADRNKGTVQKGDRMVTVTALKNALGTTPPEAVIIRTLPNTDGKLFFNYSSTNPTYLEVAAAEWLRDNGVKHLVIDLPSVDREEDFGALAAHHAFWNHSAATRMDATITELVYAPDAVEDGRYLLNLMIAAFDNDASPSKPILYKFAE